uniref:Uncharacterized protein n=1 Tax=Macrostomum lignano TaxID=282301 RepID=A0A1I8F0X4_9PLAT
MAACSERSREISIATAPATAAAFSSRLLKRIPTHSPVLCRRSAAIGSSSGSTSTAAVLRTSWRTWSARPCPSLTRTKASALSASIRTPSSPARCCTGAPGYRRRPRRPSQPPV